MRYYHNQTTKTVYRHPDEPDVTEIRERQTKRNPHPAQTGWRVTMQVDITCADNYLDRTRRWKEPVFTILSETYDYPRDSREDAVGWFKTSQLRTFGQAIEESEYNRLQSQYEAIARGRKTPG